MSDLIPFTYGDRPVPFLNERTGEHETTAPTIRVTPKGLDELRKRLRSTLTVIEGGAEA